MLGARRLGWRLGLAPTGSASTKHRHGQWSCRATMTLVLLGVLAAAPAAACEFCQSFACAFCAAGDEGPDPAVMPAFGAPRQGWPQAAKGDPVYLTYSYQNLLDGGLKQPNGEPLPADIIRASIEDAFRVWAEVAPLHFTEVPDDGLPYGSTNVGRQFGQIRFSHRYINGPDPPTGNPTTKAQAFFPGTSNISGDVQFDNGDPWQVVGTLREPDVLGAAIHEIGHALGLTHSSIPGVNMYWIFKRHSGPGTGMLFPDDIAAIRSVYGAGVGSVTPLSAVPEPAAGSLLAILLAGSLVAARAGLCVNRPDRRN